MTANAPTPPPEHHAAGNGRRLQMWRPPISGPNSAGGMGTVLARTRDLVRNNAWAGAAVEKSVANGIGVGIQAKPIYGSDALKALTKRRWRKFRKHADADGSLTFESLQALAWREWKEAGEIFVRLRSRRAEDVVPLQLQLIEAEQCPRDHWTTASNGNPIRAGIEFDKIGRRVAYWMYRTHPGDRNVGEINATELVRVPAEQVLHLYRPLRAGQIRGTPDMASVLLLAWNMGNLGDAVLERHKIANLFAGWFVREPGAESGSALDETVTGEDTDGTPIAGLEPGTMAELPIGMKPQFSDPPQAGTDYAEYIRTNLLAFASRVGVPYEVLTGDLRNISDRALRLILNEFRRLIEMDQWLYMIPIVCASVYAAWMDAEVLHGTLPIPDYAEVRDDAIEPLWVPQGWPYSHPVQDVDADIKAIRGGLVSRSSTILANGDDPDQVDAEQVADNTRADALGLKHDSDGRQQKGAAQPSGRQPPPQQEDEPA